MGEPTPPQDQVGVEGQSPDLPQASDANEVHDAPTGNIGLLEIFTQAEAQAARTKEAIRAKLMGINGVGREVMETWKKSLTEERIEEIRRVIKKGEVGTSIEELGTFIGQDGTSMDVGMYMRPNGDMLEVRSDGQRPNVFIGRDLHGATIAGIDGATVSEEYVREGNAVGSGRYRLNVPKLDPGDVDPLDVAEGVVEFLKTATIKPAEAGPPAPPSAPPPAPSV